MSLHHHKNTLKLETWENNPCISIEMKSFYRDIIERIDYFDGLLYMYNSKMDDLRIIDLYLNNKGSKNDFDRFKNFIQTSYNYDDKKLKSYFRKEKIRKLLYG